MKPKIKCLDPDYLEILFEELLQDSNPASVEKKIEFLISHYQILNFEVKYSFPIWRARPLPDVSGYNNLTQLGAPPATLVTKPGRLNEIGESKFYAAFSVQCALEEVRASSDMYIHLAGFMIEKPLSCGVIGEYFNAHRSGTCSAPLDDPEPINRILRAMPFRAGLGFVALDAFLSELLAEPDAENRDYFYTRRVGQAVDRKLPRLDGLIYPSVLSKHAKNLALKPEVVPEKLSMCGNSVLRVNKKYRNGIYDYELVKNSAGWRDDGEIVWK